MKPFPTLASDAIKRLLFELGAGYYARKLATGPEAELRREFAEFVLDSLPFRSLDGLRVLDVGCGPGHLTRLFARRGCNVTGVDRSVRLLRIARRWAVQEGLKVSFERASADRLPFADGSFDCVLATTVIYFVAQPAMVLAEMARVTRPGGLLATLDPAVSMSRTSMRAYCCENRLRARDTRKLMAWAMAAEFNRRFEEEELRALLSAAGVVELHVERRLGRMVWFARGRVGHSS